MDGSKVPKVMVCLTGISKETNKKFLYDLRKLGFTDGILHSSCFSVYIEENAFKDNVACLYFQFPSIWYNGTYRQERGYTEISLKEFYSKYIGFTEFESKFKPKSFTYKTVIYVSQKP